MVHLLTLNYMRNYYIQNRENFVNDHPGEWMLIEGPKHDLSVSYYPDRIELEKAIEKYKGRVGDTFFTQRIPTPKELEGIIYGEENWIKLFLERRKEDKKKFKDIPNFTVG